MRDLNPKHTTIYLDDSVVPLRQNLVRTDNLTDCSGSIPADVGVIEQFDEAISEPLRGRMAPDLQGLSHLNCTPMLSIQTDRNIGTRTQAQASITRLRIGKARPVSVARASQLLFSLFVKNASNPNTQSLQCDRSSMTYLR